MGQPAAGGGRLAVEGGGVGAGAGATGSAIIISGWRLAGQANARPSDKRREKPGRRGLYSPSFFFFFFFFSYQLREASSSRLSARARERVEQKASGRRSHPTAHRSLIWPPSDGALAHWLRAAHHWPPAAGRRRSSDNRAAHTRRRTQRQQRECSSTARRAEQSRLLHSAG